MIDQQALIEKSETLEPLSQTVVQLAALVGDPESSIEDIIAVASRDAALVGGILRVANSAQFAAQTEVVTVRDAILRVGPSVVLFLAMRNSVRGTMYRELPQFGFSDHQFWRHAWATSVAADACRQTLGRSIVAPEVPTAALLHDIGMLTVAQFLDDDDARLLDAAQDSSAGHRACIEDEVLGIDHAEIGALITQHWGLPESISTAIRHHHRPDKVAERGPDLVHLANVVAARAEDSGAVDGPAHTLAPGVADRLAIDDEILESLGAEVLARLAEDDGAG